MKIQNCCLAQQMVIDKCVEYFLNDEQNLEFIIKTEWNIDKLLKCITKACDLKFVSFSDNSRTRITRDKNNKYRLFIKSGVGPNCHFYEKLT